MATPPPFPLPQPPPLPGRPRAFDPAQDVGMRMLMPIGRSGWAIAAGYAGLFSLVIIGAPFAILFGILGVRDIRKSRRTDRPKHGMGRAIFGIVMGSLMLALVLLLPLIFEGLNALNASSL